MRQASLVPILVLLTGALGGEAGIAPAPAGDEAPRTTLTPAAVDAAFRRDPVQAVQVLLDAGEEVLNRVETYRGYVFEQRARGRSGSSDREPRRGPWEIRDVLGSRDGKLRMRWVGPVKNGTVLLWNAEANGGRVRARQAGFGPFFLVRDLPPDHPSVATDGQPLSEQTLFAEVARESATLARGAAGSDLEITYLGLSSEGTPDGPDGEPLTCYVYERTLPLRGSDGKAYDSPRVKVWVDVRTTLPVAWERYAAAGAFVSRTVWSRLRLNPRLGNRPEITAADFDPATVDAR